MSQLLLAAAYVALGRASLLLAIPPGYAAPVWPAAGLALAAFLLRGNGMWPGVFLGHLTVNLTTGSGSDPTSLFLAVVIAAGGTLQALAGASLVRRSPGFPNPLSRAPDILKFMLLAGPVAGLISPTVGTISLYAAGRIAGAELPFSWGTWWVGDALGVLLVTPALVLWSLPRPAAKSNRPLLVTVPLACTLAAAVGVFVFARDHENRRIRSGFESDATSLHHILEKEIDVYMESLRSLRYFFHSSRDVDRTEFHTFTERPLQRHAGFLALSWNALVTEGRRHSFEAEVRRSGVPGFQVTERTPSGELVRSRQRRDHIVVTYIEPSDANRRALGFDVGSDPARRAVFDRARDTGEPVASGRVGLVQAVPGHRRERSEGFLIALAIYSPGPHPADVRERRSRLRGYVVGVLALDRLIERAAERQPERGLDIEMFDEDAPPGSPPLYAPQRREAAAASFDLPLELPGRRWTARYSVSASEYARRRSPAPWLALVSVMSFALVLTVFLLLVTGHADAVEGEVRERTAEIERQKTLLRSIIDNMGEGVAVADADGKFIVFNAAAERIVGLGAIDAGPEDWSARYGVFEADAVTPLPADRNPLARALRGESTDDVELFVRNHLIPDGVYLAVTSRPLQAPDGAAAGGVAVFRDITARRRTADELRRAKSAAEAAAAAKAAFLANMSHEIRTPMNAVVGMAGLLQATRLDADQREFVQTLRSAADSLLTVVNDILDFSRFESGKVSLEDRDFDLEHVIHGTLLMLQPQAEAKGIDLACFCDPSLPKRVRGDAGRLRQVLLNLAGNGVKFTAKGGVSLEVRREPEPGRVRFSVRDTGIGIPDDVQPSLFAPFTQADASTSRRFGGTGLGLAISKSIVTVMGGSISLRSRVGEGSEFSFSVALPPASGGGDPVRPMPRNLKVLVVDDNAVNRRIFAQQLASWEMEGWAAENGAEARRLLGEARASGKPYDLVIVDQRMPDEDGLAFARRLKADPDHARTPLLLSSSGAAGSLPPEFSGRVAKPVNPSSLLDAILDILHPSGGPSPVEHRPAPAAADFHHLKVLLVDDNPVNLKVATLQLSKLGVTPDTADNGADALARLSAHRYDLVLLDCQMPVMDGFQTVRELRRLEGESRRTPVVAMTANALEGDREACLAAGMDDYLSKPVTLESLAATLARWDAPLDPNVLRSLRALAQEDRGIMRSLLGQFAADAPKALRDISEAGGGRGLSAAAAAAHKLKGSAASLGARRVCRLAGLAEAAANAGDEGALSAAAAALAKALDEALAAVASEAGPDA